MTAAAWAGAIRAEARAPARVWLASCERCWRVSGCAGRTCWSARPSEGSTCSCLPPSTRATSPGWCSWTRSTPISTAASPAFSGVRAREAALVRNSEGVSFADLLASDAEVRRAGPLPPVPLVVLRHGVSFDPGGRPDARVERLWTALQRDLAARSPRGQYVRVPGSHHRIAEDHPQAVVAAIAEVIRAVGAR
jgi:pimeloyl-ACP methyl ester carboxylesterase